MNVQENYFTKDNLEGFISKLVKEVSEEPLNGELAKWTTVKEGRVFDLTNNRLEEKNSSESDTDQNNEKLLPKQRHRYLTFCFLVRLY
ncbi:hypothetical protein ACTNEO_09980 [Gracilibacillus sp. HCP3S3_G5_1]|uniref:hypothetical protein n=1 Tax=unclassified Gracilibacillus TaxID=2625209 RepID=UPI003F8BBE0E